MGKRKEAGKDPKVANTSKISTTADAKDDRVASSNSTAEKKKLQQKQKKPKKGWLATIFDASTLGLIVMVVYLYTTIKGMRNLLYPLQGLEIPEDVNRIKPLWKDTDQLQIFAYLSSSSKPNPQKAFNRSDTSYPLIWDTTAFGSEMSSEDEGDGSPLAPPSVIRYGWETASPEARLELLSNDDMGKAAAATAAERLRSKRAEEESAGGSVIFMAAKFLFDSGESKDDGQLLTVPSEKIWTAVRQNRSVYLHVHVIATEARELKRLKQLQQPKEQPPAAALSQGGTLVAGDAPSLAEAFTERASGGNPTTALHGVVRLVKFEPPARTRSKRFLLQDLGLGWLSGVSDYATDEEIEQRRRIDALHRPKFFSIGANNGGGGGSDDADDEAQAIMASKTSRKKKRGKDGKHGTWVAKWKPEVAVRLVVDDEAYPVELPDEASSMQHAVNALRELSTRVVRLRAERGRPAGLYHVPVLHVDEIGLTSDKYLELNDTVASLPLQLSFSPMSPARHRMMAHFQQALEGQKEFGFADSDIDDVRRLISDTSIYLLAVTLLASVLHLFFEFLAFKSDINFWRKNKSLRGLSIRTLFIDLFFQATILLYLIDVDTSLLVTIPSAAGVLIQVWKCKTATGLELIWNYNLVKLQKSDGIEPANAGVVGLGILPISFVLKRVREEQQSVPIRNSSNEGGSVANSDASTNDFESTKGDEGAKAEMTAEQLAEEAETARKTEETMLVDKMAIAHLSVALLPLAVGFSIRSLVMEQHHGWYSWTIASLTGTVYTFGFILMTPQLFINHHLKSVSHLPWKFLCYRFVNTFIDDLFAFIIRMPTMYVFQQDGY